jgi:hypothetical protein
MLMTLFTERATKRPCEDNPSYLPSYVTNKPTERKPYLQSDYPLIKYWTRQQWKDNEYNNKDASDILEIKDKTRGGTRSAKGENVMMLYIEHIDGTPIDGNMASQIWEHARMIWKDLYQRGKAPEKWTDASRDVREEYLREMEEKWEVLRYCDNHWKASKLATTLYSVWYNQYHKKAIKGQNNNAHKGHPPNKKARTSNTGSEDRIGGSPEPENQAHGRAVSENPIEDIDGPDRELDSSLCHDVHVQIENRATTSHASSIGLRTGPYLTAWTGPLNGSVPVL